MAQQPPSESAEKIGGAALLGLCAVLVKVGVVDTLSRAETGASSVPLSARATVLVPFSLVLGASLLALPHNTVWRFLSRPSLRNPETHRATPLGWALIGAVLFPGLVLYGWLKWKLAALGYQ